jgi:hypothetical protein
VLPTVRRTQRTGTRQIANVNWANKVKTEARNIFADFISSTSPGEDADQDDCHSLRIIWERLNKDVKIAKCPNFR